MKILYIANDAQPGSPLGYCPNAQYIAAAFRELGHEIKILDESGLIASTILNELNGKNYDLILTEEARLEGDFTNDGETDKILGLFLPIMKHAGIPIVPWLTNIFWGIMRREIQIHTNPIFKADIVFTTDGGNQEKFENAGVNHVLLRQGIHAPEAYISKVPFKTSAEIGFIGSIYENIWEYRKGLVDFLSGEYGRRFEHFGQTGNIRHDKLNNLVSTLKVVVGDSVQSPHYWSNRLYEMIGRGAFLIMPWVEGIDQEFTPGEHFVTYKYGDFEGLKKKVDYYLEHDEERDRIRAAGLSHCLANHTYKHRVSNLLETLKERNII